MSVALYSGEATNAPSNAAGIAIAYKSDGMTVQKAIPWAENTMYIRNHTGEWTEWNKFVTNNDLKWKKFGTVTKNSTSLALPEDFSEIYVDAKGNGAIGTQIFIVKNALIVNNKMFSNGYYASAQSQFCASVSCSLSHIYYGGIYQDGVEFNGGIMDIYYR